MAHPETTVDMGCHSVNPWSSGRHMLACPEGPAPSGLGAHVPRKVHKKRSTEKDETSNPGSEPRAASATRRPLKGPSCRPLAPCPVLR